MPTQASSAPVEPVAPDSQMTAPPTQPTTLPPQYQPEPVIPAAPAETALATPPIIDTNFAPPEPQTPQTFEETPDEIPSMPTTQSFNTAQETLVQANEDLMEKQQTPEAIEPATQPIPEPIQLAEAPVAATVPPKGGKSLAPIIIIVLLIVAGVGVAAAAYLSSQTSKLKTQLQEITQTLEKQETTLTPTATPTVFVISTPTVTPLATPSGIVATPSATPTISQINSLLPLKNAPAALKVAIGHSPNAQLILIKVDNATDATTAVTKYFFREDTTTKKYFYVAITGKGTPEIIDKQIYVTPDDNIPSLNDAVLSNKMGIELDEAIRLTYTQCANQTVCTAAPIKVQYIKTGTGIIWQLSLYTKGLNSTPLMIQINAETKAILYKSPEFANK